MGRTPAARGRRRRRKAVVAHHKRLVCGPNFEAHTREAMQPPL
uniref:Uncharacterized protein n=1 Tax=Leersia perrieri TaxID=77586 RepID=A0A0D9XTF6_9ORYZ